MNQAEDKGQTGLDNLPADYEQIVNGGSHSWPDLRPNAASLVNDLIYCGAL
jgi:hypothetical protein